MVGLATPLLGLLVRAPRCAALRGAFEAAVGIARCGLTEGCVTPTVTYDGLVQPGHKCAMFENVFLEGGRKDLALSLESSTRDTLDPADEETLTYTVPMRHWKHAAGLPPDAFLLPPTPATRYYDNLTACWTVQLVSPLQSPTRRSANQRRSVARYVRLYMKDIS
jgi:hypothetical protein